jgi:hypothetical protein
MLAIGRLTGDLGYVPRFTSAAACAEDYLRWFNRGSGGTSG